MTTKGQKRSHVPADEEYQIWTLLSQVNDGVFRARENELRPFGITPVQVGIMYALKSLGGEPTPSEISRWVFREPHTVSAALDRMEKQGLVRRIRNSEGKRQVKVVLTDRGEEIYRAQNRQREVISRILECLSPEESGQFRGILERLRQRTLEELVVKPPFP